MQILDVAISKSDVYQIWVNNQLVRSRWLDISRVIIIFSIFMNRDGMSSTMSVDQDFCTSANLVIVSVSDHWACLSIHNGLGLFPAESIKSSRTNNEIDLSNGGLFSCFLKLI